MSSAAQQFSTSETLIALIRKNPELIRPEDITALRTTLISREAALSSGSPGAMGSDPVPNGRSIISGPGSELFSGLHCCQRHIGGHYRLAINKRDYGTLMQRIKHRTEDDPTTTAYGVCVEMTHRYGTSPSIIILRKDGLKSLYQGNRDWEVQWIGSEPDRLTMMRRGVYSFGPGTEWSCGLNGIHLMAEYEHPSEY